MSSTEDITAPSPAASAVPSSSSVPPSPHQDSAVAADGASRRLRKLCNPSSIALVGASDRSAWSQNIFNATTAYGFKGPLYAINKRGASAHGLPGYRTCAEVGEAIDLAFVMVPADAVIETIEDLASAGIEAAILLTSGFAEADAEGALLQTRLCDLAAQHGILLLGPNSLGMANIQTGAAATAIIPETPILKGSVALLAQSGACLAETIQFARQQGIGLSFIAATGNEALTSIADIVAYLADDPATEVIAIFAEAIRQPEVFKQAALKALRAGKPIVVMKTGESELSAQLAQAHTGSLVGDDNVFTAACESLGVIRVRTLEDLVLAAGFIAELGPVETPGLGVASLSGGACGIIADIAKRIDLAVPALSDETVRALEEVLPGYASTLNPLDVTGAAVRDPQLFEKCIRIVGSDPSVGVVIAVLSVPSYVGQSGAAEELYEAIGRGLREIPVPGLLQALLIKPVSDYAVGLKERFGIPGLGTGLENTLRAIERAMWWSRTRTEILSTPVPASPEAWTSSTSRPSSERELLRHLEKRGLPAIPTVIATTAEEAVEAASSIGRSVCLKVSSPDIAHKTDVGGIKLGVEGAADVREAYAAIVNSVRLKRPDAHVEGIAVSPMLEGGVELIVSVFRDPNWGFALMVGLGGIWVEALQDTVTCLLPVTPRKVEAMLASLKGARILQGARSTAPVDIPALAMVIVGIANAAAALGDDLVSLECNPVLARGERIDILDGLAIWNSAT